MRDRLGRRIDPNSPEAIAALRKEQAISVALGWVPMNILVMWASIGELLSRPKVDEGLVSVTTLIARHARELFPADEKLADEALNLLRADLAEKMDAVHERLKQQPPTEG